MHAFCVCIYDDSTVSGTLNILVTITVANTLCNKCCYHFLSLPNLLRVVMLTLTRKTPLWTFIAVLLLCLSGRFVCVSNIAISEPRDKLQWLYNCNGNLYYDYSGSETLKPINKYIMCTSVVPRPRTPERGV